MRVSLVMATYNGEQYIFQQLESIRVQGLQPDEVLIFDDKSTDSTYEIIKRYIKDHKLLRWKVKQNNTNLGWEYNFIQGMDFATGDVIFLSDQDDIWSSNKIENMVSFMKKHSYIYVLASGYTPLYSKLTTKKIPSRILKKMKTDGSLEKYPFSETFMYVTRPGCGYAIKNDFYKEIRPYWEKGVPHDSFVWRFANLYDGLYLYNASTILFRRHNNNASTEIRSKTLEAASEINIYPKLLRQLYHVCEEKQFEHVEEKKRTISECIQFYALRKELYKNKKKKILLKLLFQYRKHYLTARSALGDIYHSVRKSN